MKLRDELAEKYEKEIEDAISAYLKIDENREPLRYTDDLDIDFAAGFDACEAQYLPMIKKLESALNTALNYLYWREDDLIGDDCVGDGKLTAQYKNRVSELEQALAELAEFKIKINGGEK